MRKIARFISITLKSLGTLCTMFLVSIILLGFEKRIKTPLFEERLLTYAKELKGEKVYLYRSFYGALHLEVEVKDMPSEDILLATTIHFAKSHEMKPCRILYYSNTDSTYIVINDKYEAYIEAR